jgi:hypothetical protein
MSSPHLNGELCILPPVLSIIKRLLLHCGGDFKAKVMQAALCTTLAGKRWIRPSRPCQPGHEQGKGESERTDPDTSPDELIISGFCLFPL